MSVLSFLGNVAHGDSKPGGGVFGFLDKEAHTPVGKILTKTATLPIAPAQTVVANIPKVGKFVKEGGQATLSAGVPLGAEIYNHQIAPKLGLPQQTVHPSGPITAVVGDKDILSPSQTFSASKQEGHGSPFSFLAAGLSVAGAVPVGGGEAKGAGGILKTLSKAKTPEEVTKLLTNNGLDKTIASKVAPGIAKTSDRFTIQRILDQHAPAPPEAIVRNPAESPELGPLVQAGKLDSKVNFSPINSLKLGSDTQGPVDPLQVKKYINDLRTGKSIEPIITTPDGKYVVDGKHRIEAFKAAGIDNVPVIKEIPNPELDTKIRGAALQSSLAKAKEALAGRSEGGFVSLGGKEEPKLVQNLPSTEIIPPAKANPMQDIYDAIGGKVSNAGQAEGKSLASLSKQRTQQIHEQRGARLEASKQAGLSEPGSSGYFKELTSLKGPYETSQVGGMIENVGPGRAEELFTGVRKQIQSLPDSTFATYLKENGIKGLEPRGARLNLQTAMRKVIFGENGGIPTPGELKLIKHVNPELGIQIESKIPKQTKIFDFAAKLFGLPRALKATLDLSMGGRQGILMAARNPGIWAKANAESFKMFKSADYYHQEMQGLRARPSYGLAERYGLRLPATEGAHEEAFASSDLAEKIPVAKHAILASSRAYDGGLARMRMDKWDQLINQYGGVDQVEKNLGREGMDDLAEVVNTLTGRGGKKGGLVEKHMNSLSTTLFSPRLWASRLNTLNPYYYYRLTPAARAEALKAAGSFAVAASAALGGLAAAGAEVSTDPRSADFLKVKFGDKRYDILGGFQQNLVFAYRELSGEKVNSQTGGVSKFAPGIGEILTGKHPTLDTGPYASNRVSAAADVVGNKLNPTLSSGLKLAAGKDKSGQDVDPVKEIGGLFVPLNLNGAYDLIQHEKGSLPTRIAKGTAENVPNVFGVGSQVYGKQDLPVTGKPADYLKKLESTGASKEELTGVKSFFQTAKTVPNKSKAYEQIDEALKSKNFDKANQLASDYNDQVKKPFQDWNKQYSKYANEDLVKYYNGLKIPPDFLSSRLSQLRKQEQGGL